MFPSKDGSGHGHASHPRRERHRRHRRALRACISGTPLDFAGCVRVLLPGDAVRQSLVRPPNALLGGRENGRIVGFQAVMPRPMQFRGRPIRVAVSCQFMVDPDERRGLIALQLAKACISGPQDLTLADGANVSSQRMWIGLGGTAPLLYNLHWVRPLRPARYMLSLLEGRASFPLPLALAARPLAFLADAVSARF